MGGKRGAKKRGSSNGKSAPTQSPGDVAQPHATPKSKWWDLVPKWIPVVTGLFGIVGTSGVTGFIVKERSEFRRTVQQLGSELSEERRRGAAVSSLERLATSKWRAQLVAIELTAYLQNLTRADPSLDRAAACRARDVSEQYTIEISQATAALGNVLRVAPHETADLRGAYLPHLVLEDGSLRGIVLNNACLRHANLRRTDLTGVSLENANLDSANLTMAVLREAILTGASMVGDSLFDADLTYARLNRAQLSGAFLQAADLSVARMADADLTGANLLGAALRAAYMEQVVFTDVQDFAEVASFDSTYLHGAVGLPDSLTSSAREQGAIVDQRTQAQLETIRESYLQQLQLQPRGLWQTMRARLRGNTRAQ